MRTFYAFALLTILALTACQGEAAPTPTLTPTLVPSSTATAVPSATPNVTPTPALVGTPSETPIVVTVPPLLGQKIAPPIDVALPQGWQLVGYDTMALYDVDTIRPLPLAVYEGPVTGGKGTIVLLWGFPSLIAGNPLATADPEPNLWSDGLRLLRLAIVEQGCNIGTDLERSYRVGNLAATGTQWAAVDCPELPDTRGWFAGLESEGLNFIFYAYADPITAMDTGSEELQAILDSVTFRAADLLTTVTPATPVS
jgi:hypothetical protein